MKGYSFCSHQAHFSTDAFTSAFTFAAHALAAGQTGCTHSCCQPATFLAKTYGSFWRWRWCSLRDSCKGACWLPAIERADLAADARAVHSAEAR